MLDPACKPNDTATTKRTVSIFSVPISVCTLIEGIGFIEEMIDNGMPQLVVLANVHTLNLAYEQSEYRKVLMEAGLVLRDGTGVRWALKRKGVDALHNFVGTDFIPAFFKNTAHKRYRVFFLGSKSGVAEIAANRLVTLVTEVVISGVHHGYFPKDKTNEIIYKINKTRPDILLVAMGNPKQELWIAHNLHRLNVPVCMGVGALFDYLSERLTRAPNWMLTAGTEWIFRLLTEPKRLWKRYLIGNPKFIIRVWRETVRQKGHKQIAM